MKYQALRLLLWRWHRRLGLSAAILLIWLSISGILLNHTSFFHLASTALPVGLANTVFPVDYVNSLTVSTPAGVVEQKDRSLSVDQQAVDSCQGELIGANVFGDEIMIACSGQILLLNQSKQLLESLESFSGLPVPIEKFGSCVGVPCILSQGSLQIWNQDSGLWQRYDGAVEWSQIIESEEQVASLIPEVHNWERLILEAHSGRLFGRFGVLIMDLAALAMILLAMSGCYVWWSHNRRRKLAARRSDKRPEPAAD